MVNWKLINAGVKAANTFVNEMLKEENDSKKSFEWYEDNDDDNESSWNSRRHRIRRF